MFYCWSLCLCYWLLTIAGRLVTSAGYHVAIACSSCCHRPCYPLLGPEVGQTQWSWLSARFWILSCYFLTSKKGHVLGATSPSFRPVCKNSSISSHFTDTPGREWFGPEDIYFPQGSDQTGLLPYSTIVGIHNIWSSLLPRWAWRGA